MGLNAETLASQIVGIHAMLAAATQNPLLTITSDEGKILAHAVIDVGKQYAVSINPRVLAWINLAGAACAVYGPKVFLVIMTKRHQPKSQPTGIIPNGTGPVSTAEPAGGKIHFE